MFDTILCQRDFEEINDLYSIDFKVLRFEDDQQLKDLVKSGSKVLFITFKSSVKPDLFNISKQSWQGNCEFYFLSLLSKNLDELESNEKFFPEVDDLSTCNDYYSASGVFFVDTIDDIGMPTFKKNVMPIVNHYKSFIEYKKALFLDRDGILNVDHSYVHKVSQLELVNGVKEFLSDDFNTDRLKIVLTNQSGVSKAMFELSDVEVFNKALNSELDHGLDHFYIAPYEFFKGIGEYQYHSLLRKPHIGMLLLACFDYAIDVGNSYMVGDKLSDDLNYPNLRTIHYQGKYDLKGAQYHANDFLEVLNLAKKLPNL